MGERESYIASLGQLHSTDIGADPRFKRIEGGADRVGDIAAVLGSMVFGQEEACLAVAKAVVRNEAGLSNPNKPLGVFIFLGPTGVGKTEMARALSWMVALSGSGSPSNHYVDVDCTLLQDQTSVTRLTGASPNYVGYGDPTMITPDQLENGAVVNFDEVEKAHPSIARWLMPAIDKGVTKVSTQTKNPKGKAGEVAMVDLDFRRSYIVMTANVGAREISDKVKGKRLGFGPVTDERAQAKADIREAGMRALGEHFKNTPEFLGRIPEANIIVFSSLEQEHLVRIFDTAVWDINYAQEVRSQARYNPVSATQELRDHIIRVAASRDLGARAIRQTIDDLIVSRAAEIKASGVIKPGAPLIADIDGSGIVFHTEDIDLSPPPPPQPASKPKTTERNEEVVEETADTEGFVEGPPEIRDIDDVTPREPQAPKDPPLLTPGQRLDRFLGTFFDPKRSPVASVDRVATQAIIYVARRKWSSRRSATQDQGNL